MQNNLALYIIVMKKRAECIIELCKISGFREKFRKRSSHRFRKIQVILKSFMIYTKPVLSPRFFKTRKNYLARNSCQKNSRVLRNDLSLKKKTNFVCYVLSPFFCVKPPLKTVLKCFVRSFVLLIMAVVTRFRACNLS